MHEAKKSAPEMIERMNEVVEVLGRLIGCYPDDSPIGRQLVTYRRGICSLVTADLAGVNLEREGTASAAFPEAHNLVVRGHIAEAINRLEQDDSLALMIRKSRALDEILRLGS